MCSSSVPFVSFDLRSVLAAGLALVLGLCVAGALPAHAQKDFTVNSTDDTPDVTRNGTCDTGDMVDGQPECTLRAAIQESNFVTTDDEISFDGLDSGSSSYRIFLSSPLPDITDPVDILGNTAPGASFSSPPTVYLDAGFSTSDADVLTVASGGEGTFIDQISIQNAPDSGIEIRASGVEVADCHLGVTTDGSTAAGNATGIKIRDFDALIIDNVISGNTDHGVLLEGASTTAASGQVSGNVIGLSSDESAPVPNGDSESTDAGIRVTFSTSMTVEDNVIAGNNGQGVLIEDGELTLSENLVGTNSSNDAGLGNQFDGIQSSSRRSIIIDENVVVDNGDDGMDIRNEDHALTDNYVGLVPRPNNSPKPLGNSSAGIRVDGSTNQASQVTIGGGAGTAGDGSIGSIATPTGDGNVISANSGDGILLTGAAQQVEIRENYVGTTPADLNFGNADDGIRVVAGSDLSTKHIIGVDDSETPGSASGATSPDPADGGRGNVVAYNGGDGVSVGDTESDTGVRGTSIRGNVIYQNGGPTPQLGIDLGNSGITSNDNANEDLDTGPNQLQNFPIIDNVSYDSANDEVTIKYSVKTSTSNGAYPLDIDFYAADTESSGEGKTYLDTQGYSSSDAKQTKKITIGLGGFSNVSASDYFVATATDDDGNTSEFTSQSSPLPVELARFQGTTSGESAVELRWTTASETNNAGFVVQQKSDEDDAWSALSFVESKASGGTTTEAQTYRFTADDLEVGTHQFRLKQRDLDGTTTVHDPLTVELKMEETLQLSAPAPNPVQSQATLSFAVKEKAETTITLYNTLGQRVRTVYRGTPDAGEAQAARLDTGGLASGVYVVRLRAAGDVITRKLTVVR